jgi:hypothetical protein
MTYELFWTAYNIYRTSLDDYVIKNKEVNDIYYVAKKLLNQMNESAFLLKGDSLKLISKWFFGGSTLELKEALQFTNYDSDDIIDFNAMCLLDNISLYVEQNNPKLKQ